MKQLAVGNAIQVGLMALGGRLPYMPDWHMVHLIDHGPREFYRYTMQGINDNMQPTDADYTFSWRVPDLGWRCYWLAEQDPGDYYDRKARERLVFRKHGTREQYEQACNTGD